jgi:GTP cyclohydrolase FolE2
MAKLSLVVIEFFLLITIFELAQSIPLHTFVEKNDEKFAVKVDSPIESAKITEEHVRTFAKRDVEEKKDAKQDEKITTTEPTPSKGGINPLCLAGLAC